MKVLGEVVLGCWNTRYGSMQEVEMAIEAVVGALAEEDRATSLSPEEHATYIRTCRELLGRQDHKPSKIHGEGM